MERSPQHPWPASVSTEWLLRPGGRPAFVFAHQDDETVLAGLIHRIIGNQGSETFIWWTNGDGLAPGSGMAPHAYATMRMRECDEALQRLGASLAQKVDLASSEIENYRRLTQLARGGAEEAEATAYFLHEADRLEAALREADPDRVFVLAWQGGHPEHDLTHLMVVRAVARLRHRTGRPIPIVQCPAYEYLIACSLRFKPWFRGDRRKIQLSPSELEIKRSVFEAYPSQSGLFEKFRRVIGGLGTVSGLGRRRFTVDDYLGKEFFGVVDPETDYTRSTHRLECLNYMMDHYERIPIRFSTMIRPVARALFA